MPVSKPEAQLLRHVPFRFVRARQAGGRRAVDAPIPLVPFVDFLVALVVFLLSTFDASAQLSTPASVRVPDAAHADPLAFAPIVAIDGRHVALDGRRVADTGTLGETPGAQRIEPLVRDLETLRTNWTQLHGDQPFPGAVIVQADRSTDFRILRHVMFSAAQAGYPNVGFAVNHTGG
jgi:biopolymer transport protein ExbD